MSSSSSDIVRRIVHFCPAALFHSLFGLPGYLFPLPPRSFYFLSISFRFHEFFSFFFVVFSFLLPSCFVLALSLACWLAFFFFRLTLVFSSFWTSRGHGCRPFFPPVLGLHFFLSRIPGKVQQSHCSSIFHRVLLTHALSRFSQVNLCTRKKSQRIYTSMHSTGFELTKLTHTRLEDNLIRHRGGRLAYISLPH